MSTSIIERHYTDLGRGVLTAHRCGVCGGLTFPATTLCEHCGSDRVTPTTLSGRGTLLLLTHGMAPPPNPRFVSLAPYCYGHIRLEEGPYVQAIVTGVEVNAEALEEVFLAGPRPVTAHVLTLEGLPVLAFRIE